MDLGGRLVVLGGAPQISQQLLAHPQEKGDWDQADVGIPKKNDGRCGAGLDKSNYIVHYKNLQFYLRHGMRLKKVHQVIEFDQELWMEPYIRMNIVFRKELKSELDTEFYKLMNNLVFGKRMENLRNPFNVKIVRSWEIDKISRLMDSHSYGKTNLHWHGDLREKQDFDVQPLLQPNESLIWAKVRADLHRHQWPDHENQNG